MFLRSTLDSHDPFITTFKSREGADEVKNRRVYEIFKDEFDNTQGVKDKA